MGVADLRNAFNAVIGPRFTAERAFLYYADDGGAHYMVFTGHAADGNSFEAKSDMLPIGANLTEAARAAAAAFLEKDAKA